MTTDVLGSFRASLRPNLEADLQGSLRILVVDDDQAFAVLLTTYMFRDPDMAVVGWASGVLDGVLLNKSLRPDVVLLDYHLPDGNGAWAARLIRKTSPGAAIIVLSAAASDQEVTQALQEGADMFLSKMTPLSDLCCAVRELALRPIGISC